MRVRNAVDQTLESKAPKVIGHLRGGIRTTPERLYLWAEAAIANAARQMGKAGDGLEERHHARIAEAECGDSLRADL